MPRTRRVSPDNIVQHVLNRGNRRQAIFHKSADYVHFIRLMADAMEVAAMRILAYIVMPNHWHFVLWPEHGDELPAYMERLSNLHVRHHHAHYGTTGQGHIYQGRYHNFLVQDDLYVYRVLRYVEANALTSGLVKRAEDWPWSSLSMPETVDGRSLLTPWPVPRPPDWCTYVNRGIPTEELMELRSAARRGRPYGDRQWVLNTAEKYGLTSTLNPPHRRPIAEEPMPLAVD